ncbi:MAG TPA: chemotaxis protein CheW [Bryobacteraceae bacterium]|nr:chemotaxis protein CheW [Bryobacteraceae bacterium]
MTTEPTIPEPPLASASTAAAPKTESRAGKYLSFRLGQEEYAIQVLRVREIMGIPEITAVPQTPVYLKGVINLRGKVIPVMDLRLRFGLKETERTHQTCIIVVEIQQGMAPVWMGVIVDAVSEVLTLVAADIEDTPDFGSSTAAPYLLGMAKVKGKVKILLEIGTVLTATELAGIEHVAG